MTTLHDIEHPYDVLRFDQLQYLDLAEKSRLEVLVLVDLIET